MNENTLKVQSQILELEKQLDLIGTRTTEVYARIVGYYRSVKNWNKGKKEEYQERVSFSPNQSNELIHNTLESTEIPVSVQPALL